MPGERRRSGGAHGVVGADRPCRQCGERLLDTFELAEANRTASGMGHSARGAAAKCAAAAERRDGARYRGGGERVISIFQPCPSRASPAEMLVHRYEHVARPQ